MRVLLAFDKFKGSLSASDACSHAARVLQQLHPDWHLDLCPLTDGGEGFREILIAAAKGRQVSVKVTGPRGGLIAASIGLADRAMIRPAAQRLLETSTTATGPVAVVEMASASGLELLAPEMRDPWQASSYGTGQLLRAAAECGATAILLGVGGSATIDLGVGALAALGLELRNQAGGIIRPPTPARWPEVTEIVGAVFPSVPPIAIACDVTNPVLGAEGAAAVYGPQKGLSPEDLGRFEASLTRMITLLCTHCGRPISLAEAPGAGAAGGMPFGLMTAARARTVSGFAIVSAWLDLEARIKAADIVLTGEGRFDRSSFSGKGPGMVATAAIGAGSVVHVFAGAVTGVETGDLQLHAITPHHYSLDQAKREAAALLADSVGSVFRRGTSS